MVDLFLILLIIPPFLFLLYGLRGLHCNKITYEQRMKLIHWIYDPVNHTFYQSKVYGAILDSVSYDDHLNALIWFKDPRKLYPEIFRDKF